MHAISGLDDHIGYLMRMVSNAVSQGFARKVAGQGVTVAEWVMLRALHDQDQVAPSLLARRMGMTKGAISKLADRLVGKGLIARVEDPADGRRQTLSLTRQGMEKVPLLAGLADENDAAFFGCLTREERHALDALLRTLIARHALTEPPVD